MVLGLLSRAPIWVRDTWREVLGGTVGGWQAAAEALGDSESSKKVSPRPEVFNAAETDDSIWVLSFAQSALVMCYEYAS